MSTRDPRPVNEDLLAAIEARHTPEAMGILSPPRCSYCSDDDLDLPDDHSPASSPTSEEYPCDAVTLSAEVRRQRRVIDALIGFAKDAYCYRYKFDTCGDPFCVEARHELTRILATETLTSPTFKGPGRPGTGVARP